VAAEVADELPSESLVLRLAFGESAPSVEPSDEFDSADDDMGPPPPPPPPPTTKLVLAGWTPWQKRSTINSTMRTRLSRARLNW